ncbi:MAG: Uncharacterised protein [SAR116 cluster bacterium]|nr:MAG: Uncharacterised protein [SAR116 cluster bacterium]
MQCMVGRPAGGVQPDNGIHKAARVKNTPDGPRVLAATRNGHRLLCCGNRHRMAQIILWIDKGGTRQMQAHDFHQHLV